MRLDCTACRYNVPAATLSECRHPGATISRGLALVTGALADPESRYGRMEAADSPGGPAITVVISKEAIMGGDGTWPLAFDPRALRECSGFSPEQANAPV